MVVRHSSAEWDGGLRGGAGRFRLGNGAFEGGYTFASRFETGDGTNPEELIAAAHAACFSMALAAILERAGHKPTRVSTQARASLDKVDGGFAITRIELDCTAEVPGLDAEEFARQADEAKRTCPVSKALSGTEITLSAKLL